MADDEKKTTVGEMSVDEFAALMLALMHKLQGETVKGEKRITDLTVKEFTDDIVRQVKHGSLNVAITESQIAERVLKDWAALMEVQAVAQPFRARTPADVHKMAQNLVATLAKTAQAKAQGHQGIQFVIAVAIAHDDGSYSAYEGTGG